MHSEFKTLAITILSIPILSIWYYSSLIKRKSFLRDHPPIVDIPASEIFNKPREAYERALAQGGPVVAVRRKGRLEFIVDNTLTKDVLTDDKNFSFEEGTSTILNIHFFFTYFRTFFHELDDLIVHAVTPRMDVIIGQISPVFMRHADELIKNGEEDQKDSAVPVNFFEHVHHAIADAMVVVIFGQNYVNPTNIAIAESVAEQLADLTGIYQNLSPFARTFPNTWRFVTSMRFLLISVFWGYFRVIGLHLFRQLRNTNWRQPTAHEETGQSVDPGSLLAYLARKHASPEGAVSFPRAVWISYMTLGVIFASVHQTAAVVVWVIFELAVRPEYLDSLRAELEASLEEDMDTGEKIVTEKSMKNAVQLDSFIREVLRTKGDTLSTCRMTTRDVALGGYTLPKGHIVVPMATLSHMSTEYHGDDAGSFDGQRWIDSEKPAAMISPSFFPFGLGRWACPGRFLAVIEMKILVWSIIARATPRLQDGVYRVTDPLNITSVPPEGQLVLYPTSHRIL